MKHLITAFLGFLLLVFCFFSGCAKQKVLIGQGDPEEEIKKCNQLLKEKEFEDAVQCLEMFKTRFANTSAGQEAELRIGDAYYNKKDYLLAAESYQAFLKLHPFHQKNDYAHYRTGSAYLKESPKPIDRDQEYLDNAVDELSYTVRNFPDSPYYDLAAKELREAKRRLAKRHFYVGRFYFRTGEYNACLPRLYEVIEKYPQSGLVDRSLYMMTVANLKLGNIEGAKETYSALALAFPSGKFTKKAEGKVKRAANKN